MASLCRPAALPGRPRIARLGHPARGGWLRRAAIAFYVRVTILVVAIIVLLVVRR
jgi:hypothetical protein